MSRSEIEDAIRLLPGRAKTLDSLILEGWDLGGQRVFFTLHHLYMTRYSIYCVLFDMRQLLPGEPERKHALAVLRFWLNSITVHTVNEVDTSCAPFVLIGTHKDLVPSPHDHAQVSKILHETFGSHPAWPQLLRNRGLDLSSNASGQKTLLWFFP
eukprot:SAG11_NODE_14920_length_595_cov_0.812500_1_plen_154_part_10